MYKKVIKNKNYHRTNKVSFRNEKWRTCVYSHYTLTTPLKNNPFQFQYVLLQGHHLPNEHVVPSHNQSS